MNEGPMWEALLFASHHKLDNLILIVDANEYQAMGKTEDILNLEPFGAKLASFGMDVEECNGNSLEHVDISIGALLEKSGKPKGLIARTKKGHGISFMSGDNKWHYTRVDQVTLLVRLTDHRLA